MKTDAIQKLRRKLAGRWSCVGAGKVEGQAVGEESAGVGKGQGAVTKGVGVELQTRESEGVAPKAAGDEIQRVFEVAILGLKMVRPEIHSFRPDGFG